MKNPIKNLRSYWKSIDQPSRLRLVLFPTLTILGLAFTIIGFILTPDWGAFLLNLGTGLLGAMLITLLVDWTIGQSEKTVTEAKEAEGARQRLVIEMRSADREVVRRALEEMRERGWLEDGSLKWSNISGGNFESLSLITAKLNSVKFRGANFNNARMQLVSLEDSILAECSLIAADLSDANLAEADLHYANLSRTDLTGANLKGAFLADANLSEADFFNTILILADLSRANLHNARNLQTLQLLQARSLRSATMPDGEKYDGRYELNGDITQAKTDGFDIFKEESMSHFYDVPLKTYQDGQNWRQKNLKKISEYLKVAEERVDAVYTDKDTLRWDVKKLSKSNLWIMSLKNNTRIDSATAPMFEESLAKINENGGHKIIINLREIGYCSSAGFRALIGAQKAAKRYNRGEVVLCSMTKDFREAIELTGLDVYFRFFDTIDEAILAFEKIDGESKKDALE